MSQRPLFNSVSPTDRAILGLTSAVYVVDTELREGEFILFYAKSECVFTSLTAPLWTPSSLPFFTLSQFERLPGYFTQFQLQSGSLIAYEIQ